MAFKAFLTDLNDKFESAWNETSVYGRMDPIWTYQNTKRTISVGFAIPAYDPAEATKTQEKLGRLARFLYPTYKVQKGIATLSASPLFRVKFANLIQNSATGAGLLGVIQSFEFKPNLEMGFFPKEQKPVTYHSNAFWDAIQEGLDWAGGEGNILYAKEYEISFDLHVLHEHALGYSDQTGRFRGVGENFPFRSDKVTTKGIPTEEMTPDEIKEARESMITDPGGTPGEAADWKQDNWDGPNNPPFTGPDAAQFTGDDAAKF